MSLADASFAPAPIATVRSLFKSYGSVSVLKDVSFTMAPGEALVLLGRSGSGKSTLLRCMNGLEKIDSGEVKVADHAMDYHPAKLRALRRDVGIVFQQYNLFPHLTVGQNIMLAPRLVKGATKTEAEQDARDVLRQVDLSEKFDAWPDQLSGGQQQRVAIARSLAMKPKLMLFDEVTSALDPELTGEVLAVMERLSESGMAMIVVTHEIGFARKAADRVIFMHAGRIHEECSPEEMLSQPKTAEFRAFLGSTL